MPVNDDTWVVIPLFNEAPVIAGVVEGLRELGDDAQRDIAESLGQEAVATGLSRPVGALPRQHAVAHDDDGRGDRRQVEVVAVGHLASSPRPTALVVRARTSSWWLRARLTNHPRPITARGAPAGSHCGTAPRRRLVTPCPFAGHDGSSAECGGAPARRRHGRLRRLERRQRHRREPCPLRRTRPVPIGPGHEARGILDGAPEADQRHGPEITGAHRSLTPRVVPPARPRGPSSGTRRAPSRGE